MAGAFVLCCIIVLLSSAQSSYSVSPGDISQNTITAPWDIVDDVTTNSLVEEARAKAEPVYILNSDITSQCLSSVESDYAAFDKVREMAKDFYVTNELEKLREEEAKRIEALKAEAEKAAEKEDGQVAEDQFVPMEFTEEDVEYSPADIDWRSSLKPEEIAQLYSVLPSYITDIDLSDILKADADSLKRLEDVTYSKILKRLSDGVKSEDLILAENDIITELSDEYPFFSSEFSFLKGLIKNDLTYNLEFDAAATQKAQDDAAAQIEPVMYKQGQNIVVKGEVVTPAQYYVLQQSGLITETMNPTVYIPALSYMLLLFVLYMIYLAAFAKDITHSTRKMVILSILTVLAMVFCVVSELVAPNVYMIFCIAILAAILVDPKQAFVFSTFVAFVLITASGDVRMFFTDSALRTIIISVTGSLLAIIVTAKTSARAAVLLSGLVTVIPCSVVYLIMILMDEITPESFGLLALWALGGGLLCGLISLGLLPVFEAVFKIITPAKLIELTDPRRKLLRRLMLEAPGTYHHSLAVGNLAENACEIIGADALLARAGAYYHDIGKLESPEYFVENQDSDYNPHDFISPEKSVSIITAHVSDGREMAEREKLPAEIRNIIFEHHGTTKVAYFLHKAKEQNPETDENAFRYHANKPTSKESAIIMLADSVEAAMRAAGKTSDEDALAVIRKIIRAKYNDGQLDFTPITLKDLDTIARVFAESYKGKTHKRIQYPDEQDRNND